MLTPDKMETKVLTLIECLELANEYAFYDWDKEPDPLTHFQRKAFERVINDLEKNLRFLDQVLQLGFLRQALRQNFFNDLDEEKNHEQNQHE